MKKLFTTLCSLLLILVAFGQDTTQQVVPEVATGMRADGKIYVVVAVVVTILLGLFAYVIRLDRKISKLEKQAR